MMVDHANDEQSFAVTRLISFHRGGDRMNAVTTNL
jgi:hypothetical protein